MTSHFWWHSQSLPKFSSKSQLQRWAQRPPPSWPRAILKLFPFRVGHDGCFPKCKVSLLSNPSDPSPGLCYPALTLPNFAPPESYWPLLLCFQKPKPCHWSLWFSWVIYKLLVEFHSSPTAIILSLELIMFISHVDWLCGHWPRPSHQNVSSGHWASYLTFALH